MPRHCFLTIMQMVMPRSHSCRSFWLDGHFSGSKFETSRIDIDSPVISELHTVLSLTNSDNSVIAIDDARMFLGHHNCRSRCLNIVTLTCLQSFIFFAVEHLEANAIPKYRKLHTLCACTNLIGAFKLAVI